MGVGFNSVKWNLFSEPSSVHLLVLKEAQQTREIITLYIHQQLHRIDIST